MDKHTRVAFVTGASRGIGKAIADRLRGEYEILSPTRNELDLRSDESIERFIAAHRGAPIDVIVNNAGINEPEFVDTLTDQNIKDTFQVNLVAPIKLIRGFVGGMKQRHCGRIINIASMFGIVGRGKQSLYTGSKAGIIGVTKALALELAEYNILVNAICPGFVDTDLTRRNTPEKNSELEKLVPLGRFADAKEIAELVAFLVSEKNTYITGEAIVIDGGFTSR
ncbi:MAG: Short-chain dehydrogenase/reductase SDR [Microgenomates group bacterium GW2011_GWA1_48_10]|nr:MAG: Short-chain dehydrogenase/reductase SDR [Microgenomates group bacterium GW2011_GWA1_48_10]